MRVFRPFFVSLNLPYSVIRGEKVILQAIVFNYLPEDLTVQVTLALSKSFSNILIDAKGQEQTSQKEIVQNVLVRAGDAKSVFFPITPLELGKIDIEVKARSTKAADAIRRQLLVKAEGVSKDYNIAVLIDLTEGKNSFSQTVNLSLPTNVVKESQRVRISAVGDLMGPTIGGLDSLLQMPMGCGEQTMLSMAPDVYITDYLTAVNQLTADIKSKALNYMESGYQRELTYKHKDGSFSAFGESDKSGSMWLTAFVMRVFNQAKPHIYIDEQVMITSLRWIIAKQNSDGSFPEPGVVIHTSMQGNAAGGIALTLYVMITLLENKDRLVDNPEKHLLLTMIVLLFSPFVQLQFSTDGLTFWHQVQAPKTSTSSWESPNPTQSTDTEMTAYILLTYIVRGEIAKAKNIVQWLIKQRSPHGGFQSTQDTVVALHALSQFAKIIYSKNFNLQVTATLSPSEVYTFNIDQSNALVLQTHETKDVPSKVKIDATGSGIGLVEVAVYFNVESDIGEVTFELSVKLVEETMKHLLVETCTKWIGEGASSGMAIQEFGIPSGFKFDIDSFRQIDILKKIEFEDRKVVFYFDKIGTTPICLQMRVKRDGLVAKSQPVPVKVIDYYNPNNQVTVFYQSAILKNSTICDVVNEVDNCVSVSK
ncbi:unnamed protein product [Candidula unifasciata]|uniref:Alpha-macroglobulin receptor-binding domain-containing protein n=1 Tax=Candidula unifasciata TaxID=100452 RepID=A0A8S4AFR7_9EUPU|nr:unnamed protein product [Candidula unifasciata]